MHDGDRLTILVYTSHPVKAWRARAEDVERLRATFPRIAFRWARSHDEALATIGDADIVVGPVLTPDLVAVAPRLKWVHSSAAAVEGLMPIPELAARGIVLTNARGVQGVPIAEHVMGGLLVLSRKFNRTLEAQRERRWIWHELNEDWPWLLHGKSMTIVGLGTIGLELAKRADAFGMHVTGVRRRGDQPIPPHVERVFASERIDEALDGCDILVIAAPAVSGTSNLITRRRLALLNRGAIVVNVARAQIVESGALVDALQSGHLGGAVLDVFETEPLDPTSPLWSMPNVVVTPHSSGFRATHWGEVTTGFIANLERYLRGEPLMYVVDPALGY
jgi:phosphoglycerate dehydrogenase-like enzyme